MTPKQQAWYQDTLSAFAVPGNRYNGATSLTYCAACLGISAEQVIEDAHAAGVTDRDSDIRRGIATAAAKVGSRSSTGYTRPRHEERQIFPGYVRSLISDGGNAADFNALRALSPINLSDLISPPAQTAAFLAVLYEPNDLLYIFDNGQHRHGEMGRNILTRDGWLERLRCAGSLGGDCVFKNPLTGRQGTSGEGQPSFTSRDCIAAYRYALVEFDTLPIAEQCAFWLGWLRRPNLAPQLAALTFSGGKSIHGLIRTGADAITAPKIERGLRDLLCSAHDGCYRADTATLKPHGGTRLAGAIRGGSGVTQTLLYLAR